MRWLIDVKSSKGLDTGTHIVEGDRIVLGTGADCDLILEDTGGNEGRIEFSTALDGILVETVSENRFVEVLKGESWELMGREQLVSMPVWLRFGGDATVFACLVDDEGETPILDDEGGAQLTYAEIERRSVEAAIMVLDICGSSLLAAEDDRLAYYLASRLFALSHHALVGNGALFYKDTGDGFMATFPTASSAAGASMEVLGLLGHRNENSDNPPHQGAHCASQGQGFRIQFRSARLPWPTREYGLQAGKT